MSKSWRTVCFGLMYPATDHVPFFKDWEPTWSVAVPTRNRSSVRDLFHWFKASDEGTALVGLKTSERSSAVFFCSGRSTGASATLGVRRRLATLWGMVVFAVCSNDDEAALGVRRRLATSWGMVVFA